jgi:hypothetical protein
MSQTRRGRKGRKQEKNIPTGNMINIRGKNN